ncbi:MAG: iron chelate uptake ABC transporter family permease subunit [Thermoguttaceae bacterium]|jgi:zinc transport system permease protein
MIEFFDALRNPNGLFLRYALLAGVLASVSFGIVGSYVVTRRITYIAAAISHCVLGGIGAALYLNVACGWQWCNPMQGALAAALLSAIVIGLVSLYARQREDTVISAVWALGMAIGLVFLYKAHNYNRAMSFLFGDINLVGARDVWTVLAMNAVVVVLGLGFYPKLLALCFDEEFAELRGVRTKLLYMMLLCLTAIAVVLLVRVVGIVLVIALLTLPAAIAGHFVRQLWQMMALAVVCCMAVVTAGIAVSYPLDVPSGPVIILIAGAAYLAATLIAALRRRGRRSRI